MDERKTQRLWCLVTLFLEALDDVKGAVEEAVETNCVSTRPKTGVHVSETTRLGPVVVATHRSTQFARHASSPLPKREPIDEVTHLSQHICRRGTAAHVSVTVRGRKRR